MWFTFASRRAYGVYGVGEAQLWVAAVDLDKAATGEDPSFAAFRLPFQDDSTGNHIAQWVSQIVAKQQ